MFNGHALQSARQAKGLSRDELAAIVGVSRQSVWLWETGGTAPKTAVSLRLCAALDVSLDSLYIHEAEAREPLALRGEVA